MPQWLEIELIEGGPKLQLVVKRNPAREEGELRCFLASQQEVGLSVTTYIHLRLNQFDVRTVLIRMCSLVPHYLIVESKWLLKEIFVKVEIC